ncbi:hypothetical protein NDU88_003276, partial [Pleurodeles waltl]
VFRFGISLPDGRSQVKRRTHVGKKKMKGVFWFGISLPSGRSQVERRTRVEKKNE